MDKGLSFNRIFTFAFLISYAFNARIDCADLEEW
jgi:hypothetical protein